MQIFIDRKKAFTLVEIMVVLLIVSLLASLAIPQMLRSRMNANETAAIGAMRHISNSCQVYYNNVSPHTYPPNGLSDLTPPASNPSYINTRLAAAINAASAKQGYYYVYTLIDSETFTLLGRPSRPNRTGVRIFYINEIGVMTYTTDGTDPGPNSLIVQ